MKNPISEARQKQLAQVFEDLEGLLFEQGLLRFEAVEELLNENMEVDLQYLKDEFITAQVKESLFHKQVEDRFGMRCFKGLELTKPLPQVTKEEFLQEYEPAKYLNQRRWVRHWLFRGRCLRRWELFQWIMETAKPRSYSSRAPLDKVI